MTATINPATLKDMVLSGAYNLQNNKDMVDALNVFPVPDGDTGTNMSLTILSAAKELEGTEYDTVDAVAEAVASATLRGARGNSGVILSQIFRGMAKGLKGKKELSIQDAVLCFDLARDTAYRAVMKPTEGTILTVIRSCAEAAEEEREAENAVEFFSAVIGKANETLSRTPEMLPALKKAGVVDSGGKGLCLVLEGMLKVLTDGVITEPNEKAPIDAFMPAQAALDPEEIHFAYCTEFLIRKSNYSSDAEKLKKAIGPKGDCMVVIDDLDVVKVHIHTNNPGFVLEQALKVGELFNLKIENMKEQNRAILENQNQKLRPKGPFGIIAVASGSGLTETLRDLGADIIIEGGQTMNPSTEDIVKAIDELDAEEIFVLPNNKNIILTANQAKEISEKDIYVIPTKTIPQGIAAMIAVAGSGDAPSTASAMEAAAMDVKTGLVTFAVRDTTIEDKPVKKGDILGLEESHITTTGTDKNMVARQLVKNLVDEETAIITIFYGADITEAQADELCDELEDEYADIDVSLYNGGQGIYSYIISIEN